MPHPSTALLALLLLLSTPGPRGPSYATYWTQEPGACPVEQPVVLSGYAEVACGDDGVERVIVLRLYGAAYAVAWRGSVYTRVALPMVSAR